MLNLSRSILKASNTLIRSLRTKTPIFQPISYQAFSIDTDRALIDSSKDLVISRKSIRQTNQEQLQRELEKIYHSIVEDLSSNSNIIQALNYLNKNPIQLKTLAKKTSEDNDYVNMIYEMALEVLKKDFSGKILYEVLKFCDAFEIQEQHEYERIAKIVLKPRENPLPLSAKLRIMSDFESTLPLADYQDIPEISSLSKEECVYLLYLVNVKKSFKLDELDCSDPAELTNRALEIIDANTGLLNKDQLTILFLALSSTEDSHLTSQPAFQQKLSFLMKVMLKDLDKLPLNRIIEAYYGIIKSESCWSQSQDLASNIVTLLDEGMNELNLRDTIRLVDLLSDCKEISGLPAFYQDANRSLVKSLVANVLPNKSINVLLGHTLVDMLDLCVKWGVWDPSMNEVFSAVMVALFEIYRLSANSYIKMLSTMQKLNNGSISPVCLALLRVRPKDFIRTANINSLVSLHDMLGDHKELQTYFRMGIMTQIDLYLRGELPGTLNHEHSSFYLGSEKETNSSMEKAIFKGRAFPFILNNLSMFSKEMLQLYSDKLESIIELFTVPEILNISSFLTRTISVQGLMDPSGAQILYTIEEQIRKDFDKFDDDQKNAYIQGMSVFTSKLRRLKELRKDTVFCDSLEYSKLKQSHSIVIAVNNNLFKEYQASMKGKTGTNQKNEADMLLFVLNEISPQESQESIAEAVEATWARFKENKNPLREFVQTLRVSNNLRENFKANYLDKDPQVKRLLLNAFSKEVERDLQFQSISPKTVKDDMKSPYYHVFVMTNFLAQWKMIDERVVDGLFSFIMKNFEAFNLNDILMILTLCVDILRNKRHEIYDRVHGKLGLLMSKQKLTSSQAYSILMSMPLHQLDDKTLAELEKTITSNFLSFKVQEIVKLVEKLERCGLKRAAILYNIVKAYFQTDFILNLEPKQLNILSKALLKEDYINIGPMLDYYLVKNKAEILKNRYLPEVLYEYTQIPSVDFSPAFIDTWRKAVEDMCDVRYLISYFYIIATEPKTREVEDIYISDKLSHYNWMNLLSEKNALDIVETARACEGVSDRCNFLEENKWIGSSLAEEALKRYRDGDIESAKVVVYVFASFRNDLNLVQMHSRVILRCIEQCINLFTEVSTVSKVVLLWARCFEGSSDIDGIQRMRNKVIRINPHLVSSHKVVEDLLKAVAEVGDKMKKGDFYFTRRDFKLMNRIEDIVILRAHIFKEKELAYLYKVYVDSNLGSNKILEFLEKKVL